jgi:hypothetical protein|tara:strand:- start:2957 stop:3124 length:168 start_codon:yes stop_codon:yes gene_type:complete
MKTVKSKKFKDYERKMSTEQANNMVRMNDHYYIVESEPKKQKTKRETKQDPEMGN